MEHFLRCMRLACPADRCLRLGLRLVASLLVVACLFPGSPAQGADDDEAMARSVATLLRSARAVISMNQALINDAEKGDKGITPALVVATARENYKKALGHDIDSVDPASKHGKLLRAELQAITDVMTEAQVQINQPGVGYKGFLPAVFARLVSQKFRAAVEGQASLKLTAPKDYIRNRANRPDEWEDSVIEQQFRSAGWEKGKGVTAASTVGGKAALRLIIPEYYDQSCLSCHGEPKGERDISGGRKEGAKLGDLGGAVSVTIFR